MTGLIVIMQRKPGQQIPRPFSHAGSEPEAQEMLGRNAPIDWSKVDTDEPAAERGGNEFFLFRSDL